MSNPAFLPYKPLQEISENEMKKNSLDFLNKIGFRKSIRHFSDKPVPLSIIKNCIKAAGTAPSGANLQPWQFVVVSDPNVKKEIRIAARNTQGVRIFNLSGEEKVVSAIKIDDNFI